MKAKENNRSISELTLIVSRICNLSCRYCYADRGTYGKTDVSKMSFKTARNAVERIEFLAGCSLKTITFFGGEPLTNFELIRKLVPWIEERAVKLKQEIPKFSLNTNGILIDEDINNFLNKHFSSITVSIDGLKKTNDYNRIFPSGEGSFDKIDRVLKEVVCKNRKYNLSLEVTTDKLNYQGFSKSNSFFDVEHLMSYYPDEVHIAPAVYEDSCFNGDDIKTGREKYYLGLANQYYADKRILEIKELKNILKTGEKKKHYCSAGIKRICVSTDGAIYPCFTFIGKREYHMGNVNDEEISSEFELVSQRIKNFTYDNNSKCNHCWAKGICTHCIGVAEKEGSISLIDAICSAEKKMLEGILLKSSSLVRKK